MILTIDILQRAYDHCNRVAFDSVLPSDITLSLHDSLKIPGRYDFTVDSRGNITYQCISISRSYDWDYGHLQDVLMHEMIHEYLYYFGKNDGRNPHGKAFVQMMNDINQKWNRHITIDQDESKMKVADGQKPKWSLGRLFKK